MAQAMALEPEALHLALDTGVGVMVPVVGQSLPVVGREGDQAHDGRDFLSEGGQARTVSAVDAEAVGGAELLLLQRFASASRAALAVQSVRAVHWSWHRQRESPVEGKHRGAIKSLLT